MTKVLVAFILIFHQINTSANIIPFDDCFSRSAERYSLSKDLLLAIAMTESNLNPNAIGPKNKNGSYDIGMMQINSNWIKTLESHGISEGDLIHACTNIDVGAWILANNIKAFGQKWMAVGAYNARTMWKREVYVSKVLKHYTEISNRK